MNANKKSVPKAGLEPARPDGQQILSLSCLPIPPLGHNAGWVAAVSLLFCSCALRKQDSEQAMLFRILQGAQVAWQQGDDVQFESIVNQSSDNSEILYAMATRLYTQRGRENWDLSDLQRGKQYALKCLWEDFHFRTLVTANHGIINAQSVKALDINNPTLVECGKWFTVSWALTIHNRELRGVQSDVETLQKLGLWLGTIESVQEESWTQYARLLALSVGEQVDWTDLGKAFDEVNNFDNLIQFERLMLHTRYTNLQEFCDTTIEHLKISENHKNHWKNQRHLCE